MDTPNGNPVSPSCLPDENIGSLIPQQNQHLNVMNLSNSDQSSLLLASSPEPSPIVRTANERLFFKENGVFPRRDGLPIKCIQGGSSAGTGFNPATTSAVPEVYDVCSVQQRFEDALKEGNFHRRLRKGAFPSATIRTTEVDLSTPPFDNAMSGSKPRILVMGLPGSGKSAIHKFLFRPNYISPVNTPRSERTKSIVKYDIFDCASVQLQSWDVPWKAVTKVFDETLESFLAFKWIQSIIFLIDAQGEHMETLACLKYLITRIHKINKPMKFDILIHKADTLSNNDKDELVTKVTVKMNNWLKRQQLDSFHTMRYHLTSIYDSSLVKCFNEIVQQRIPNNSQLQELLDGFAAAYGMNRAYILNPMNGIPLATMTSTTVDLDSYKQCCDAVDMIANRKTDIALSGAHIDRQESLVRVNQNTMMYISEMNQQLAFMCTLQDNGSDKNIRHLDANANLYKVRRNMDTNDKGYNRNGRSSNKRDVLDKNIDTLWMAVQDYLHPQNQETMQEVGIYHLF